MFNESLLGLKGELTSETGEQQQAIPDPVTVSRKTMIPPTRPIALRASISGSLALVALAT